MFEVDPQIILNIISKNIYLFVIVVIAVVIRLVFLLLKLLSIKKDVVGDSTEGVSVIITCNDKGYLLRENLISEDEAISKASLVKALDINLKDG